MGERFADVNIVNRVPHGGGWVLVWAISYQQQTPLYFIHGNFYAQRYYDEILRPIVVPLNPFMFQHNAQPHVARICTQFREAENVPVLPWPAYSPDMSPIEHVWGALVDVYDSVFQFPPMSSNFTQPLKMIGTTFNSLFNSM